MKLYDYCELGRKDYYSSYSIAVWHAFQANRQFAKTDHYLIAVPQKSHSISDKYLCEVFQCHPDQPGIVKHLGFLVLE